MCRCWRRNGSAVRLSGGMAGPGWLYGLGPGDRRGGVSDAPCRMESPSPSLTVTPDCVRWYCRSTRCRTKCTFDSHIVVPHISIHTTASIPSSRRNGTSLLPPPSLPPRTAARPSSPRPRAKRSPPTGSRAASSSSPSPIFRTMSPSPGARSSSASRTSRDTTASSTSTAWT